MPRWPDFRRRRSATPRQLYSQCAGDGGVRGNHALVKRPDWFGTLRWRYLGTSPLTEDNAFRSPPTSIFNARIGYRFDNGWRIQLDALNLFNTKANQITYAYGSLIKTDSLYNLCFPTQIAPASVCQNGVMDYVLHPVEPLAIRLTVAGVF